MAVTGPTSAIDISAASADGLMPLSEHLDVCLSAEVAQPHSNDETTPALLSETTAISAPADTAGEQLALLRHYLTSRTVAPDLSLCRPQKSCTKLPFTQIGQGQCGTIYEDPGALIVYKVDKGILRDGLKNDRNVHVAVEKAFRELDITSVMIPHYEGLMTLDSDASSAWWQENLQRFPVGTKPADLLISERILPLVRPIRDLLTARYCPEWLRSRIYGNKKDQHCLARVILGQRRERSIDSVRFFTLRNFGLSMDKLIDIDSSSRNIEPLSMRYARAMGEGLAAMHWQVGTDADDVEWVLGSNIRASSTSPNLVSLWLIDFNRCKMITPDDAGVARIVASFFRNDAYYPRPLGKSVIEQQLWNAFSSSYLSMIERILERDNGLLDKTRMHLAAAVIDGIVQHQAEKMDRNGRHGDKGLVCNSE